MCKLFDQDSNKHYRSSESRNRPELVDTFVADALKTIFSYYPLKDCPTIFFNIWELTYLSVFDSPDGPILNHKENVELKLVNPPFSVHWEKAINDAFNKDGPYSIKSQKMARYIEYLTWNPVRRSLIEGAGKHELSKQKLQPQLISLYEYSPFSAHDLITGKRVQITEALIAPELLENCDCKYCVPDDHKNFCCNVCTKDYAEVNS